MDLYPEILYSARAFRRAPQARSTLAPIVVLVATADIRRGQEILRDYLVR